MTRRFALSLVLVPVLLLALFLFLPGINVLENAWMIVESGKGNWVPESASLVSFECTQASQGGNTSYCFFGQDWTNYYAACDPLDVYCRTGFTEYSKEAAEQCAGFDAHRVSTWCDIRR